MLAKFDNYKGVILFYILLILIIFGMSYRNNHIDTHSNVNNKIIENF